MADAVAVIFVGLNLISCLHACTPEERLADQISLSGTLAQDPHPGDLGEKVVPPIPFQLCIQSYFYSSTFSICFF